MPPFRLRRTTVTAIGACFWLAQGQVAWGAMLSKSRGTRDPARESAAATASYSQRYQDGQKLMPEGGVFLTPATSYKANRTAQEAASASSRG